MGSQADYTPTPDRRYFVVRGRLWRLSNPFLDPDAHERLVRDLMNARRAIAQSTTRQERISARLRVDAAKRAWESAATLGGRTARRITIANSPSILLTPRGSRKPSPGRPPFKVPADRPIPSLPRAFGETDCPLKGQGSPRSASRFVHDRIPGNPNDHRATCLRQRSPL